MFSDRRVVANGVDTDQSDQHLQEQSDQGLHCLPVSLHLLDALFDGRDTLFKF